MRAADLPVLQPDRLAQGQLQHLLGPGCEARVPPGDAMQQASAPRRGSGGQRLGSERLLDAAQHRVQVDPDLAQRRRVLRSQHGLRWCGRRSGDRPAHALDVHPRLEQDLARHARRGCQQAQEQVLRAHVPGARAAGLDLRVPDDLARLLGEPLEHLDLLLTASCARRHPAGVLLVHRLLADLERGRDLLPRPAVAPCGGHLGPLQRLGQPAQGQHGPQAHPWIGAAGRGRQIGHLAHASRMLDAIAPVKRC